MAELWVRVVAALILREGRVLIAQRPPGGAYGGKWEFPGGKVDPGEDDRTALARELAEELGLRANVGPCVFEHRHTYPHVSVHLFFYACSANPRDEVRRHEHSRLEWVDPGELETYDFLEGDRLILGRLRQALKGLAVSATPLFASVE